MAEQRDPPHKSTTPSKWLAIAKHAAVTLLVAFLGITTFIALRNAHDWAGDWVGPVWLLQGYTLPYAVAALLGRPRRRTIRAVAGGGLGGMTIVVPGLIYVLTGDRGYEENELGVFFGTALLAAIAEGAIIYQVGVGAHAWLRRKSQV